MANSTLFQTTLYRSSEQPGLSCVIYQALPIYPAK